MFFNKEAETDIDQLSTLYLVTAFEQIDLGKLIYKGTALSYEQFKILTYNLLNTIKFLHLAGVVHRDLKPNNILINLHC